MSLGIKQPGVTHGEISPRDLRILRELVYPEPGTDDGAIDTAIYTAPIAEYTLTDLGDGYLRVAHLPVETEAEAAAVPGGSEFRPYDSVARDAMAAFLYRYAALE